MHVNSITIKRIFISHPINTLYSLRGPISKPVRHWDRFFFPSKIEIVTRLLQFTNTLNIELYIIILIILNSDLNLR